MTEATNKLIKTKQSLSTEEDTRVQYNRLPIGIWLVERVGVLSRLDSVVKKKWYVIVCYNTVMWTACKCIIIDVLTDSNL